MSTRNFIGSAKNSAHPLCDLRAAEVSSKCPIYAALRYPVFALFLETLAARKMLVFMPVLNQNSVFEFQ